jgi:hypothetical protein
LSAAAALKEPVAHPSPWPLVRAAVRANVLPGVLLWVGLALFLAGYFLIPAVPAVLDEWVALKTEWGALCNFVTYGVFAVAVPELLQRTLLRQGSRMPLNWGELGWAALVWGVMGVVVNCFYLAQSHWFGEGNDALTLVKKMAVDQFIFSQFANFLVIGLLGWRELGFSARAWTRLADPVYLWGQYLPIMVAGWCVWIPAVMVVYFMPTPLQFPVVSMVLSYWILVFKFLRLRR